jgi:hypothetical protein
MTHASLFLIAATAACTPQLHLAPPSPLPPAEHHAITGADRGEAIEHLAAALEEHYVLPDKATAMARMLRDHLACGDYNALATGEQFAQTVTENLKAIAHDKHLEVLYFAETIPPIQGQAPTTIDAEEAEEQRYQNQGVVDARRMKLNLGYLEFHEFGRPGPTADKLAAAMRLVADTKSLIVDLRECHGGDPETVTLAESYFVPAKTHLLDMYTRDGGITEHVFASTELGGPHYDQPMVVVIGEDTASGCEAFAYAMQSHGRATVIGTRSAGAAYFGDPRRLGDHFMAFVPIGRPIDPITHADWESVGVVPTVVTPSAKALDVAELTTLQRLLPNEASKRRKQAIQKRIAELSR